MNKIRTYDDLLEQEQKMKLLLQAQKELVLEDIRDFKEELKPVKAAANFFSSIISRDKKQFFCEQRGEPGDRSYFQKNYPGKGGLADQENYPLFPEKLFLSLHCPA